MTALKLVAIGSSTGVIVPDDLLARMNLQPGDSLYVTEEPDGSLRVSSVPERASRTIEVAEDIMRRYSRTLDILAR